MERARKIAKFVVLAQIASDAGKDIWDLSIADDGLARTYGYTYKQKYIEKAIRLIDSSSEPTGWRYYTMKAPDQNGYPSFITYFWWKDLQVSFHTPVRLGRKLRAYNGTPVTWDRGDSQLACMILASKFRLYA